MQQAHYRHSLVLFALSLGELTWVRHLRCGVGALAQMLGVAADARREPRLGSMSSDWLRQHESEVEKRGVGQ